MIADTTKADKYSKMQQPKLLISLDYELFFGPQSGSVDKCLIDPVNRLVDVLDKFNAKVSLFVDSGFLFRLTQESIHHPALVLEKEKITRQLTNIVKNGHDIQLHIHPHWQDTTFDGSSWRFKTNRYRLQNFNPEEIESIVNSYTDELKAISPKPVFAFRAGGWCAQPFLPLVEAFKKNGIWLDSTVFACGKSTNPNREFDYTNAPVMDYWRFSHDPVSVDENGDFIEVPISSLKVSPLFFWKMIMMKAAGPKSLKPFGDGTSLSNSSNYYLSRLTKKSISPASLDGLKASLLETGYKFNRKKLGLDIYNVMGHPKSLTSYSLGKLDVFLKRHPELQSITFQDLAHLNSTKDFIGNQTI